MQSIYKVTYRNFLYLWYFQISQKNENSQRAQKPLICLIHFSVYGNSRLWMSQYKMTVSLNDDRAAAVVQPPWYFFYYYSAYEMMQSIHSFVKRVTFIRLSDLWAGSSDWVRGSPRSNRWYGLKDGRDLWLDISSFQPIVGSRSAVGFSSYSFDSFKVKAIKRRTGVKLSGTCEFVLT